MDLYDRYRAKVDDDRLRASLREVRFTPLYLAGEFARAGIYQELVGDKPVTVFRIVWSVHPIPIENPWLQTRNVSVKYFIRVFRKFDAGDLRFAVLIEEAKLDALSVSGKQRKVDAAFVRRGAKRARPAGLDIESLIVSVHSYSPAGGFEVRMRYGCRAAIASRICSFV